MVVECPSGTRFPAFGRWFGYIVQKGCPAQPEVIGLFADIIEHFERMVEVVLMRPAITGFNALQGNQFREDELQQARTVQVYKSFGRNGREQNLVQLVCNALFGYDGDALFVAA